MFYALELVFGGTDGVRSRYHVFAPGHIFGGAKGVRSRFDVLRLGLVFDGSEGVGSRIHFLRARTRFRRYRRRRVPFSSFALRDSFWAV
jgi:hypothetical protein